MKLVPPTEPSPHQQASNSNLVPSPSSANSPAVPVQKSIGLFLQGTKDATDEIRWIIHMMLKDSSDLEIESDSKVLKLIAPNDLKNFGMSAKKLAYTKKAIGDWFWENVVLDDLKGSFYTLMFDDTTNIQHKKELQLVLKYWSSSMQQINFVHLQTSFLSSGKAVPAVEVIKKAISENKLPLNQLVQLGCDGPNVTKSVKAKVNQWLKDEAGLAVLFDLGSCNNHALHNAFKAGCELTPNVHKLCQQISDYFKSPQKWEEFAEETGAERKFVTFFSIRWTSLGPSTARIGELWKQLEDFFEMKRKQAEMPKAKPQAKNEKRIIELLNLKGLHAEVLFVNYVASLVEPVLTFLERADQVTFQADDRYSEMLGKLVAIVLMPGHEAYRKVIESKGFEGCTRSSMKVTLPEKIEQLIPQSEKQAFHLLAYKFIRDVVSYLHKKKFFHPFLYDVKAFSPEHIFEKGSVEKILAVADYFKPLNQNIDKTKLMEELALVISTRNQEAYENLTSIDKFYGEIEKKQNRPELCKLFRLVSAVSISNAEVERNFSRSKNVITYRMSNLQEENFNSRKRIISGMKFFNNDVGSLPISTMLVQKVHFAHRDYKRKLDDNKISEENSQKRQRMSEELTAHVRNVKEASELYEKQIESATAECEKFKKDLEVEERNLSRLLNSISTCDTDDQDRFKELVKASQLSASTISSLKLDFINTQKDISKMQNDRIKKLTRKESRVENIDLSDA